MALKDPKGWWGQKECVARTERRGLRVTPVPRVTPDRRVRAARRARSAQPGLRGRMVGRGRRENKESKDQLVVKGLRAP